MAAPVDSARGLAVVGWRRMSPTKHGKVFNEALEEHIRSTKATHLVSGGASGADSMAEAWAKENNMRIDVFKADWTLGKKAGPIRNTRIVENSVAVLAFVHPDSRGTWDTINKAKSAGKPTSIIRIN